MFHPDMFVRGRKVTTTLFTSKLDRAPLRTTFNYESFRMTPTYKRKNKSFS